MELPRVHEERSLRPHLLILIVGLAANLVYCGLKLAGATDYLEVLQIACTILILVHWSWGASFYYYYFRAPDGARFFLLDVVIAVFLTLAVVFSRILYLWFLFILVNYALAVLMYRVKPASPHFSERVRHFASRKSIVDLIVLLLLILGMVLDLANRTLLHLDYIWRPFCILTTTVMTVGATVLIFATRFYDLSKSDYAQ
jgi:hypothetical protein